MSMGLGFCGAARRWFCGVEETQVVLSGALRATCVAQNQFGGVHRRCKQDGLELSVEKTLVLVWKQSSRVLRAWVTS